MPRQESLPVAFSVEIQGKRYEACYTAHGGLITVEHWGSDAERAADPAQVFDSEPLAEGVAEASPAILSNHRGRASV